MKFERINDKQIRCTLTSIDLSMRNLGPNELAYGNSKVKDLFTEMMQKASQELGFEADGTPIMIEAIPQADQSVVLVITKVEDPEELDTRFSKFSEAPEGNENIFENIMKQAMGLMGVQPPQAQGGAIPLQPQITQIPVQVGLKGIGNGLKGAFVFPDLDSVIDAAKAVTNAFDGQSTLYKNPETKEYFLVIRSDDPEDTIYLSTCNLLSEYCRLTLTNYSGESYYEEHYETIIRDKALEALRKI